MIGHIAVCVATWAAVSVVITPFLALFCSSNNCFDTHKLGVGNAQESTEQRRNED
ncbi:hypothetical protein [Gluconobacter albidus]|uniref:hypothetical protein n=1 Tax=Gluconobacter albidus TaxID=318683 RepID=UPI001428CD59|nr:hypothetical protein [Gluconobacter albidus]